MALIDTPPLEPLEPLGPLPPSDDVGAGVAHQPGRTASEPSRWSRLRLPAAFAAFAVLAGAAGGTAATVVDRGGAATTPAVARQASSLTGEALDIAGVIAKAEPSVVSIAVGFGGRSGGAGTGIILNEAGDILTNAHVVEGARDVRVTLFGESQSRAATVVGSDPAADLALLRVSGATDLVPADLGSSAALQVGDDVVAIGNALALRGNPTVTRGIVSGLNRSLETESGTMTGLIQTDASISSGNSGGPLVDASGRVIGINTAVAASSARTAAENVGFAIAIDQALPVIERLRGNTTTRDPGVLGVRVSDPTDGSRGALLVSVEPGSAAARAGLQAGDLVVRVGESAIDGAATLTAAVRAHSPGSTVTIVVVRDGQEHTAEVVLGS